MNCSFVPLLKCHHTIVKQLHLVSLRTTTTSRTPYNSEKHKPFINSDAHKLKVKEKYDKNSRQGYPFGVMLVGLLVYLGLVNVYDLTDESIYKYLTKDISDKFPPHQLEIIKQRQKECEEDEIKKDE